MKNRIEADRLAQGAYGRLRRQALWHSLRSWFRPGCNDLIPTAEVLAHLGGQTPDEPHVEMVPVDRIVGSAGRFRDFDLAFRPRHQGGRERWLNIARARYMGVHLPRPMLLKIGSAYFVEDGNHRVSVARAAGERAVEAFVTEIDPSTLIPDASCSRLGFNLREDISAACK